MDRESLKAKLEVLKARTQVLEDKDPNKLTKEEVLELLNDTAKFSIEVRDALIQVLNDKA